MAKKRTFLMRIGRETYCDDHFYVRAESVADVCTALGGCTRYSDDDPDDVPEDVRRLSDAINGHFDDKSNGIISSTHFIVNEFDPIDGNGIDDKHPLIEI